MSKADDIVTEVNAKGYDLDRRYYEISSVLYDYAKELEAMSDAERSVWHVARIAAEGSDWKRDEGESIAEWLERTLAKRPGEAVQPDWAIDLYSLWCEWSGGHITDRHFACDAGEIIGDKCCPSPGRSEGK
jgi:hypothetical protein